MIANTTQPALRRVALCEREKIGERMKRISKLEMKAEAERMCAQLQHEIVTQDLRGIELKWQVARIRAIKQQLQLLTG